MKIIIHKFWKELSLVSLFFLLFVMVGCQENTEGSSDFEGDSMSGNYLSARFARHIGEYDKASEYFANAIAKDPNNNELLREAYELMLMAGNVKKSIELAKKQKTLGGNVSSLSLILIQIDEMQKGEYQKIIDELTPFYKKSQKERNEFNSVIAPMMIVWSYAGQEKYAEGRNLLKKIKEENNIPFITYQEVLINDLSGDSSETKKSFDELLEDRRPYRIINKAISFYKRIGQEKTASEILEKFLKENPSFKSDIQNFSPEQESKNHHKYILNSAAEVFFEIADLLYNRGQFDDALLYLRMANYFDPESEYIKILLANTLEKEHMQEEALEIFSSIKKESIFYRKSRISIALLKNEKGDLVAAKKDLLFLAEKWSKDYESLLRLGDILMAHKNYEEASEVYTKAIDRMGEPSRSSWPVFYTRGICFERLSNWEKAEKDFFKALEIVPNQPDVLNYLGYNWLIRDKNIIQAEEMLQLAVMTRPDDAYILDSYGWALFKMKRYEDSLSFLEKATLLMPYDPTTNDHLGDIYWQLGRYNEAKFQWKRALIFNPEPKDEEMIRSKLEKGLIPVALVTSEEKNGKTENIILRTTEN